MLISILMDHDPVSPFGHTLLDLLTPSQTTWGKKNCYHSSAARFCLGFWLTCMWRLRGHPYTPICLYAPICLDFWLYIWTPPYLKMSTSCSETPPSPHPLWDPWYLWHPNPPLRPQSPFLNPTPSRSQSPPESPNSLQDPSLFLDPWPQVTSQTQPLLDPPWLPSQTLYDLYELFICLIWGGPRGGPRGGPITYLSCLSLYETDRQLIPLLNPLRQTDEQLIQVIWGLI